MERERIDQLYQIPLEAFTSEREALAREAREGDDEQAAREIRALRKPSVAAWAVNRLARERPDEVNELLKIGAELRRAQREALGGGDRSELRKATSDRRRLVDRLVEAASEILAEAGHGTSRAILDRVAGTLLAATANEAAAEQVRDGRLQREVSPPSGLEELAELMPGGPPEAGPTERGSEPSPADRQRAARARERAERLDDEASEAEREARRLRDEADRASRVADRALRAAQRQEERAARARERAEDARRGADEVGTGGRRGS